jgi:hypothetical protein
MNAIHFVCRQRMNVTLVNRPDVFDVGHWDVTSEAAERLVGGRIYLHERKAQPSYFGGRITDWRITHLPDEARSARVTFRVVSDKEGKGARWPARTDVPGEKAFVWDDGGGSST